MSKRKVLGIGTIVVFLIIAVIAITVVYAAYNSNLTINGSATAKATKWSVIFTDLQDVTLGNDNNVTSTAKEIFTPTITGQTAIGDYSVELHTPGDYAIYKFKIKNAGDFPAKIDSSFSMPTPLCTKGTMGTDDDATNVCNNLEYTLTYVSDSSKVKIGDTFEPEQEKEVQLKIHYKNTITSQQLPTDDVTIGNLKITIPFVQY